MSKTKIVIVCANVAMDLAVYQSYYKIGVEQGTIALLHANLTPDLVCGDFDSVTASEKAYILQHCKNILQLPEKKDYLDGEVAILEALKIKDYQSIDFIAQGNRLDMNIVCFGFLNLYQRIKLLNDTTKAYALQFGNNKIKAETNYNYVSLIAFETAVISIHNMKYQVEHFYLPALSSRALSNEFIEDKPGEVIVHSGKVAIIFSKK